MTTSPRVFADTGESVAGVRRQPPRWGLLWVGAVLGFGLAVVVLRVDTTAPVGDRLAPVDESPVGVADVITGFPDALRAVVKTSDQGMAVLTWPVSGDWFLRDLPAGDVGVPAAARFDPSGQYVAIPVPLPQESGFALFAGRPGRVGPVAGRVSGFAWSDSTPGLLAYSSPGPAGLSLSVMRGSPWESTEVAILGATEDMALVAHGAWGWALGDGETLTLLTPQLTVAGVVPGRLLDSRSDGLLVLERNGWLATIGPDGEVAFLPHSPDVIAEQVGVVAGAELSPDGTRLAVLGQGLGMVVFGVEDDSVSRLISARTAFAEMVWSSDGRFVLFAGGRGLTIVDTEDWSIEVVLGDMVVRGLGVMPLVDPADISGFRQDPRQEDGS